MSSVHFPREFLTAIGGSLLEAAEAAHLGVSVVRQTNAGEIERVFANRSMAALFGYTVEELMAAPTLVLYPPDEVARMRAMYERRMRGESIPTTFELVGVGKNGARVDVEVSFSIAELDGAQVTFSFVRDLGGRRRAEEEQKKVQAKLFEADRMATIGTLAAGVAHEINNPLTYALLNLGFLAREVPAMTGDPARLARAVATVKAAQEGAGRVATIVRDLRLLARQGEESGPVDVGAVFDSTINLAMSDIRVRARVAKRYEGTLFAHGSPGRLGQVFLNLLLNAAHAIPEGNPSENELCVTVRSGEDDTVVAEVTDTGTGMPPEVVSHIFEPFFTTKPPGIGNGLGLWISRNIVTSMNGELTVESRVGGGSTFRVTLPGARATIVGARSAGGPPRRAEPPVRARVLIVDDEPALAEALARALAEDHETKCATGGRQALAWLETDERFDVVLCDVVMPETTGLDVHAALRARSSPLAERFIFMTGAVSSQAIAEALGRSGQPWVEKPMALDALRELIRARARAGS